MIFLPGQYQLTPKDLAGASLEFRASYVTNSLVAALVSVYVGAAVAADRVWALTNITAQLTPGAAQRGVRFEVVEQYADSSLGTDFIIATQDYEQNVPGAAAVVCMQWTGLHYMRPGSFALAQATYSAGANANALNCSVSGFLVPRANIQLAG